MHPTRLTKAASSAGLDLSDNSIMNQALDLEARVSAIEARNRRVDMDKAWETSKTRRTLIAALTYLVIATYLLLVVHISPWLNAVVPTTGFLMSTLVVGVCKRAWADWHAAKRNKLGQAKERYGPS